MFVFINAAAANVISKLLQNPAFAAQLPPAQNYESAVFAAQITCVPVLYLPAAKMVYRNVYMLIQGKILLYKVFLM